MSSGSFKFITYGTIGRNAGSARICTIAKELKVHGYTDIQIISQFPGRDAKTSTLKLDGIKIRYLSSTFIFTNLFFTRVLKVIVGHVQLFLFIVLQTSKRDILYFYCPTMSTTVPAMVLAKFLGKVVVTDVVELFQHEKNTWYNRLGDKWAFKYATIAFSISDRLMEYGRRHTDKAIVKLPIVVDFERFDHNIKPQAKLIGYVGTSAAKDGLDVVLKGFAEASKRDSELRLKLIGPKPIFFNFDKLVAELEIEDKIELTGSIPFEQIPQLLLECDTFIMNRDESLFAQFGYPTKLGEYFACYRPVLMSDGLGFSEDFEDKVQAIKYDVKNPKALADAMLWRYANETEAQGIAQNGYEYAFNHFNAENIGRLLIESILSSTTL